MMKNKLLAILAVGLLAGPMAANAVPITFDFTGSVSSLTDPLGAFSGVVIGTGFSGSYTFESTTADAASSTLLTGRYAGALTAFSLTIGGVTLTYDGVPNQITVNNNVQDAYSVFAGFAGFGGYSDVDLASMGGTGPSNLFATDALTLTPDFFASLTQTFFNMQFYTGSGPTKQQAGSLTGTLTSLSQNVPEPGTLALFGLGLAGLGFSKRRKHA